MREFIIALILFIPHLSYDSSLSVDWVKVNKEIVGEGEIVEIEAKISNKGISKPFAVYFYYDFIDERHLIGIKYYESIKYYRYPKVRWDTKGLMGKHKIIVYVDGDTAFCNITICESKIKENLLIKEVYYYCYKNRDNEYICIYNAGEDIRIGEWYITTQPWKRMDKQNKIIFPDIILKHNESIYVTKNGSSFKKEKEFEADYEYYDCSTLPDIKREGKFILANDGGVVCLKDRYNHTIDVVIYGNASFNEGWNGEPIKNVKRGEILIRKDIIDTNSSKDWETKVIGQSDYEAWHGIANKGIAFCSPDCSYIVISNEIIEAKDIIINMYLFTNPFLMDKLLKENASIKLLLDGNVYGGLPMEERYIAYMLHNNGGEVKYMMSSEEIHKRYRYDHAKYVIIDGEKCIIESANWAKSGIPVDSSYRNREWGILIENKSVAKFLMKVFLHDWNASIEFNESSFTHGKPPKDYTISYFIPEGNYHSRFSAFDINFPFNITIILSPDNAEDEIIDLIEGAENEILVEQAYIEMEWNEGTNPFIEKLIEKNESGVRVFIILDGQYTINKETYEILTKNGMKVKLHNDYTIHNKGLIIDGNKVLISSINWGENSVRRNREIGVIVESKEITEYFENIFWYDWNYEIRKENEKTNFNFYFVLTIFIVTFIIIYLGRRNSKWI